MRQLLSPLTFIFVITLAASAYAQDPGGSGMIYGKDHAYSLTAPKGWVLDNKSGLSQGAAAVFYPVGSSWANGIAVMYTNAGSKGPKQTIDDFILGDINDFKGRSPSIKVTSGESISIPRDKKVAQVRYFSGDANGNFEAVAYIDEPKVVVMVILTSKTKKDFDLAFPAFRELLDSYYFLSSEVVIQK